MVKVSLVDDVHRHVIAEVASLRCSAAILKTWCHSAIEQSCTPGMAATSCAHYELPSREIDTMAAGAGGPGGLGLRRLEPWGAL